MSGSCVSTIWGREFPAAAPRSGAVLPTCLLQSGHARKWVDGGPRCAATAAAMSRTGENRPRPYLAARPRTAFWLVPTGSFAMLYCTYCHVHALARTCVPIVPTSRDCADRRSPRAACRCEVQLFSVSNESGTSSAVTIDSGGIIARLPARSAQFCASSSPGRCSFCAPCCTRACLNAAAFARLAAPADAVCLLIHLSGQNHRAIRAGARSSEQSDARATSALRCRCGAAVR